MPGWAGIAIALRDAEDDGLRSRVSTHLHPLAGRPVVWHVLRAMLARRPAPRRLAFAATELPSRDLVGEIPADLILHEDVGWLESLPPEAERIVIMDATAPALDESLRALLRATPPAVLRDGDDVPIAVCVQRDSLGEQPLDRAFRQAAAEASPVPAVAEEAFLVRDRAALSHAAAIVRDRIVARLMSEGVTFLLPGTVLLDVDVRVGRDSVVYPGVMLEGQTTIGSETVIGPGCRIVDSRIGNGVELKGWNYIVRTSIRNRAVLEPYVRRGFD